MNARPNSRLLARVILMGWLAIPITAHTAAGQAVIFSESFDGVWQTASGDLNTSGFGYWTSSGSGDTEWHRRDYTAGWSSSLGDYAPGGAEGTPYSARFHSYDAGAGASGWIATPWISIWTYPGPRALSFWYINPSGTDTLFVHKTHDGFNFTQVAALGVAPTWTRVWVDIGMSGFSSVQVRFEAVSDNGTSDIGLDEVSIQQGIAGTIRVGQDHPETPRLTEAFAMLDSATAQLADVRIEMDDSYDNGIDVELLPLELVSVDNSLCAPCSVWVGPAPGASPKTTAGSSASAVIRLVGAHDVVLDGRPGGTGGAGAWTIRNTNAAGGTAVVWLSSPGAGQGAARNRFRRLALEGGTDTETSALETFGFIGSGNSISNSNDGQDNDDNVFDSNSITAVRTGIHLRGALANLNTGNLITGNTVGPDGFGPNRIGRAGIIALHQSDVAITGNVVRYVGILTEDPAPASDGIGIGAGTIVWPPAAARMTGARIEGNDVSNVVCGKTLSAVGIALASSVSPSGNVVANNSVRDVVANGTGIEQAVLIGVGQGSGDQIVFNSLRGYGDLDPVGSTSAANPAVGIRVASTGAANLTVKNNVVAVGWSSNNGAVSHYAIVAPSSAFAWGTGGIDHNDYWPDPASSQARLGGLGTGVAYSEVTTLASWQAQFTPSQDGNSVSESPPFETSDDLHLQTGVMTACESGGTPIAGVPGDFDGDLRNGSTPDIGFDEGPFAPPNRAPVIRDIADVIARWGRTMLITVIAHDRDCLPLTYSALDLPPGASIESTTGRITWDVPDCPGDYGDVTVIATDACGAADSTSFGIHSLPLIAASCFVPQEWVPKLVNFPADTNGNFVEDMLELAALARRPGSGAAVDDSTDVFLYFNECHALTGAGRESTEVHSRILFEPTVIAAALVRAKPSKFLNLAGLPFVAMVAANHTYGGALNTSVRTLGVRPSTTFSPATVQDSFPMIDGTGQIIAILDSGVDGNHESTTGSACASGVSFVDGTGDSTSGQPADVNGHGTHGGGAAIGRGNASGDFAGPASKALYSDVRVLSDDGGGGLIGFEADVVAGLQYSVNSFGTGTIVYLGIEGDPVGYGADPSVLWNGTDLLSMTINAVTQAGLIVVAPVGNADVNNTPLLPPAVADEAIVVAASAHMGNVEVPDSIAAFSKPGPRESDLDGDVFDEEIPHVTAPGTDLPIGGTGIVSALANSGNQYVAREGTCAAAAQVAGVVALLQQASNGGLTASAARQVLIDNATRFAPPQVPGGTWNAQWGHGAVDAFRALDHLIPEGNPGFDVFCFGPGNWFYSTNIQILDPVLFGDSVRIMVTVHNKGGRRIAGYEVEVGAYSFGNSPFQGPFYTFKSTTTLEPDDTESFECKWYVNPGLEKDHGCIKAFLTYARDGNPADNCANYNVDIVGYGSSNLRATAPGTGAQTSADFRMWVANLLRGPVNVRLIPTVVEGSDWVLTSSETTLAFPMMEYEPPREVFIHLTPGSAPSDSYVVDIAVAESTACSTWNSGGGRLIARLGGTAGVGVRTLQPTLIMAPRPFREDLNITFAMPRAARVGLRIYDVSGREVHQIDLGEQPAGVVRTRWDGRVRGGRDAAPGVYFIRIRAGDQEVGDRVIRLR